MVNMFSPRNTFIQTINSNNPDAYAKFRGNSSNPRLFGTAYFYKTPFKGLVIEVEAGGLPADKSTSCGQFFAIHIHENGDCTNNFSNTGNHYNPQNLPHPFHAGDLPPLLGNGGYAYTCFYTCRLELSDVINRSLIIHRMPDDFTTQPSGNSGEKIACGVIKST